MRTELRVAVDVGSRLHQVAVGDGKADCLMNSGSINCDRDSRASLNGSLDIEHAIFVLRWKVATVGLVRRIGRFWIAVGGCTTSKVRRVS